MNVTHDPALWCSLCTKYLGQFHPGVILPIINQPRICLDCLRLAVEACERDAANAPVIGRRE